MESIKKRTEKTSLRKNGQGQKQKSKTPLDK